MRRYVPRRSCLPCVNNMLQPPSPLEESHGNSLESSPSGNAPDSSEAQPHVPLDPPMISPIGGSDPKPNPDNAESSKGSQRRTTVSWFKSMMKSGGHSRTTDKPPSQESPQTGTPPSNEKWKHSIISHAQRVKVRPTCLA